jgi:hypothetical protein
MPGGLALSESEKAEALANSRETQFQPMDVGAGRYWDDAHIRLWTRKWTEINQSLGGPTGDQGTQGWQGSGPERYSEQGPETSIKAGDKLSHKSV